jgi:hypothetical protein
MERAWRAEVLKGTPTLFTSYQGAMHFLEGTIGLR